MPYRGNRPLVWFVHFHKAGGSSVVELARREGLVFAPWHANGNPLTNAGKFERPWELSPGSLRDHVEATRRAGTQFVSSEWGVPDLDVLTQLRDVVVVAVLRDPVERVISNFRFDRRQGFTAAPDVLRYIDHHVDSYTWTNYYLRQVLGRDFTADGTPLAQVGEAIRRLRQVHHLAFLDDAGWLERLAGDLGWAFSDVHVNRLRRDLPRRAKSAWLLARRGRFDVAPRALRPDVPVTAEQRDALAALNALDLQLLSALRGTVPAPAPTRPPS